MRKKRRRNRRLGHAGTNVAVRSDCRGIRHRDRRWAPHNGQQPPLAISYAFGRPGSIFLAGRLTTIRSCLSGGFIFGALCGRRSSTGGAIAGASGMVAVVVAIAMSVWRSGSSRAWYTTYWLRALGERQDIRQAGLTQPAGVPGPA